MVQPDWAVCSQRRRWIPAFSLVRVRNWSGTCRREGRMKSGLASSLSIMLVRKVVMCPRRIVLQPAAFPAFTSTSASPTKNDLDRSTSFSFAARSSSPGFGFLQSQSNLYFFRRASGWWRQKYSASNAHPCFASSFLTFPFILCSSDNVSWRLATPGWLETNIALKPSSLILFTQVPT